MTSLGAMMSGGNPASGQREDRDFYATPIEAIVALLEAVKFDGVIHEPACGNGAIGRPCEAAGYRVVANDIHPLGYGIRHNFFTIKKKVGHNIITNPPFNIAEDFIRHGMTLDPRKMAMLLKSTYFSADKRAALFDEFPPRYKFELTWRLDFKNLGRPTMECAWFVWERGFNGQTELKLMRRPEPEVIRQYSAIETAIAA